EPVACARHRPPPLADAATVPSGREEQRPVEAQELDDGVDEVLRLAEDRPRQAPVVESQPVVDDALPSALQRRGDASALVAAARARGVGTAGDARAEGDALRDAH